MDVETGVIRRNLDRELAMYRAGEDYDQRYGREAGRGGRARYLEDWISITWFVSRAPPPRNAVGPLPP